MSRKLPEVLVKKSKLVEHFQSQANAAGLEAKSETQQNAKAGALRVSFQRIAPQSKVEGGTNLMLSVTRPLQSLLGAKVSMQSAVLESGVVMSQQADSHEFSARPSGEAGHMFKDPTGEDSASDETSPFSYIAKLKQEAEAVQRMDASAKPLAPDFIYLVPRGPYDLVIEKYHNITKSKKYESNYFTMSRKGITHYFNGNVHFTTLERWQHEYACFQKIMNIAFFRQFRIWKAFYFWRQYIRTKLRTHRSRNLENNLFILNPDLRTPLLELRKICTEAARWKLFKIDANATQTLAEFTKTQDAQRNVTLDHLTDLANQIRHIALKACQKDLKSYLRNNDFKFRLSCYNSWNSSNFF